jgi:hypothetical protein
MSFDHRQFLYYHPYLTYAERENRCFIAPNGKSYGELDLDAEALFRLGRIAYGRLSQDCSKEEFARGYTAYLETIDAWRVSLLELYDDGKLVLRGDESGTSLERERLAEADDSEIVSMFWQMCCERKTRMKDEPAIRELLMEVFLFNALKEIDHGLIGLALDGGGVVAGIEAANSLSNAVALESGDEQLVKAKREFGYQGVGFPRFPGHYPKLFQACSN